MTLGLGITLGSTQPTAASRPISAAESRLLPGDDDLADSHFPALFQDVLAGFSGRIRRRISRSTRLVFSTMTTASAPGGSGAPVMISAASPGFRERVGMPSGQDFLAQTEAVRPFSGEIRREDREAVYQRLVERREVDVGGDVLGGGRGRGRRKGAGDGK